LELDKARSARRDERYAAHATDEAGRHLADGCAECERIEGLERDAGALPQLRANCVALHETLKDLHEKHGCPYCLYCATAGFLITYVEHFQKTGTHLEVGPQHAPGPFTPNPRFEKIVAPAGYPVARFYTKIMSTETEDPNHFILDRETLARIVEREETAGRPAGEHGRALKALDEAIREWAQTPWDGK
jgi:hypothetical protein